MRISDWSSDVCSSDLPLCYAKGRRRSVPFCIIASNGMTFAARLDEFDQQIALIGEEGEQLSYADLARRADTFAVDHFGGPSAGKRLVLLRIRNDIESIVRYLGALRAGHRSEEHTSELQSLMR